MALYSDKVSDLLTQLRPEDLACLLSTEDKALLGCILRLNQDPLYHNQLNAVVVVTAVLELRGRGHVPDRRS